MRCRGRQFLFGAFLAVLHRIAGVAIKYRVELAILHKDWQVFQVDRIAIRFCAPIKECTQIRIQIASIKDSRGV